MTPPLDPRVAEAWANVGEIIFHVCECFAALRIFGGCGATYAGESVAHHVARAEAAADRALALVAEAQA